MVKQLTEAKRPAGPISQRMKAICADTLQRCNERHGSDSTSDKIEVFLVDKEEDLESCYRLLHKQYLSYGYTDAKDDHLRVNLWNTLPETYTIAARIREEIVGTVSFVVDSTASLPMDDIAGDELDLLRHQKRKLCEVSGLAVDNGGADATVLMEMFRYGYKIIHHFTQTTDLVITVNPRHEKFYAKLLLFEKIGPTRSYAKVKNAPGVPMRLDLESVKQRCAEKYQHRSGRNNLYRFFFVKSHAACMQKISLGLKRRQKLLSMSFLHEMFVQRTSVLRNQNNYRIFKQEWSHRESSERPVYEQQ